MRFSDHEVREINAALPVHDGIFAHADLAIIFGTRFPMPVTIAVDLLARSVVPVVVLTGGINRKTAVVEALAHRDLMLASGVAHHQIVVESTSSNTLENVTFALPLVADIHAIRRVAVIGKWHHSRRCMMTLKRWWPAAIEMYPCTYDQPDAPRASWWLDAQGHASVGKEWYNIPRYLQCGDIAEIAWNGRAYV